MEISISNRAQSNIENIVEFTLRISTNYANSVVNENTLLYTRLKMLHILEDMLLKFRTSIIENEFVEIIE